MFRALLLVCLLAVSVGRAYAVPPACSQIPALACLATDETWGAGSSPFTWTFNTGTDPDPTLAANDTGFVFTTPGGQANFSRQIELEGADTGVAAGAFKIDWDGKTLNSVVGRAIELSGNPSNNPAVPQALVVSWVFDGGGAGAQVFRSDILQTRDTAGALAGLYVFDDNTIAAATHSTGAGTGGNITSYRSQPLCRHEGCQNSDCTGSGAPCACCTGSGTGTCGGTATMTCSAHEGLNFTPRIAAVYTGSTATSTDVTAVHAYAATSTGLGSKTITNYYALKVDDIETSPVTNGYSVYSSGTGVEARHAGSMHVGATTAPSEKLHLSAGNMRIEGGSSTGALDIGEYNTSSDAAAPADNRAKLYVRDNGAGKEQVVVRFNTGAVQVLATEP